MKRILNYIGILILAFAFSACSSPKTCPTYEKININGK